MPLIKIFNESEKQEFDNIPKLTDEVRKKCFQVEEKDPDITYFRKDELLVGYLLLKGYFLASGRFFLAKDFNLQDIEFICKVCKIETISISKENFPETTYRRHKNIICERYGVIQFKEWKEKFTEITDQLVKTALKPRQIILTLTQILRENKVEIPRYFIFAEAITNSINQLEKNLTYELNKNLSDSQKEALDNLLTLPKKLGEDISPSNPYFITTLKKPEQSEAPLKIRESLEDFSIVSQLFEDYSSILNQLLHNSFTLSTSNVSFCSCF